MSQEQLNALIAQTEAWIENPTHLAISNVITSLGLIYDNQPAEPASRRELLFDALAALCVAQVEICEDLRQSCAEDIQERTY